MSAGLRRFGPAAALVLGLILLVASGAWRWFTPSQLAAHRAWLDQLARAHLTLALALFFVALAMVVATCLPGVSALGMLGGAVFGPWLGGAAALAACLAGSIGLFLACRTAVGGWARRRGGGPVTKAVQSLAERPFLALLSLKLFPAMPYFVPNIAAAAAGAPLWALAGATVVGSAPFCFLMAALGSGMGGALASTAAPDPRVVLQPPLLAPFVGLALLAVAPLSWRLWRAWRETRR